MRSLLRSLTALTLSLVLLTSVCLAGFAPIREDMSFQDVPDTHWANEYVSQCYTLGLLSGTGGDWFSPGNPMKVSEAVTLAVRLNDIYHGGDGVLDQSGAHWYDSAVAQALELGILTEGQFDSYDRAATRAELAGLLAHALPQEEYAPINQITTLPDVDSTTAYRQEIFTLYNAGILSGSDQYGTFNPQRSITRAEVSALACRLALPETRLTLSLLPKPADTTAYTSGSRLELNGMPIYGLVRIDGKYYLPVELLEDRNVIDNNSSFNCSQYDNVLSLSFNDYFMKEMTALNYWAAPPEGKSMGKAQQSSLTLKVLGTPGEGTYQGAIFTLGGKYPMVSLEALGAVQEGDHFRLDLDTPSTLTWENDLAGGPVSSLQRGSARETVIAIHDYLVNTLTYDPLVSAPWGASQSYLDQAAQAIEQASQTYALPNNQTLASKFGICQNYAELFRTLCIRSGIPCVMVTGMGNGDSHAWNQVYVDGQWLYVDCTFDDPVSLTPTLDRDYCLVGPETMVIRHYWDGDDYPMPDEYDPAWEQLDPYNITSADMFRKCLVAQVKLQKTSFSLRTTRAGAYGGTGCLYAYPLMWWSMSSRYNSATGTYDFTVEY